MNTSTPLHLYLDRQDTLLLVEALVEQPFKLVFETIGKLNQRLAAFKSDAEQECIELLPAELSTCIKALGELPYKRVCTLVNRIHQQLLTQHASVSEAGHPLQRGAPMGDSP